MKKFIAILILFFLGNLYAAEISASLPAKTVVNQVEVDCSCQLAQHNRSSMMVINETSYVCNAPVKVNENHHNDHIGCEQQFSVHCHKHALCEYNSNIESFSRSVDKYIYALRHIII